MKRNILFNLLLMLVVFFVGNSFHIHESAVEVIHHEQSVKGDILFVIKVPISEQNSKEIEALKAKEAKGVSIKEMDGFLTLQYIGKEFVSEVNPEFILDIKVLKGEDATSLYPEAPENGVIEMIVNDASTLEQVFYALKAS